jgi:hypothetical protein
MHRLNVVSGGADREIDGIRETLETYENAAGLGEVIALLQRQTTRGRRVDLLDAIGHSRPHGFLVIGEWLIDDSPQTAASFGELLRPLLRQLGVRMIRLLGCSTASTARARIAMRRIAQVTRCHVWGTKRFIGRNDYGPMGFISDDALSDADGFAFQDPRSDAGGSL